MEEFLSAGCLGGLLDVLRRHRKVEVSDCFQLFREELFFDA